MSENFSRVEVIKNVRVYRTVVALDEAVKGMRHE